jgi:hypothetical protein
MHDREILRRAQYNQDNGPLDDLYVIPTANTPASSPAAINNFPALSQCLRTIRYPKDFKLAINKYDGRSDMGICLKRYNITARASGGNGDHKAGYFLSYGPPWAHYLGGYPDRLLGGPLGLPDLCRTYLLA